MKSIIGIILIVVALVAGYQGIQTLNNSGGEVDILGIEIKAQDKGAKEKGYIYIGIGVVALLVGASLMRRSR